MKPSVCHCPTKADHRPHADVRE
ncbi:hypothetical protein STRTUCAR8_03106, partial [Streptomyces turgidiscabies Car8]